MEVYTIGFTQTAAAEFFGKLRAAGIKLLIDVRLNNTSQLAGWAKRDDLRFFLAELCRAEYLHEPLLAPSKELFDAYKKHKGSWDTFRRRFLALMAERRVEEQLDRELFSRPTVLLCSEPSAEHCHRRLILEYLGRHWGEVRAVHL